MDFNPFAIVTFDCYGTLIDWETGLLEALRPIFAAHSAAVSDAQILGAFAELEREAEAGPYRGYRSILEGIVADLGLRFGFAPSAAERESLPHSIARWQPFPDTVAALRRLHRRLRIGILSNIDDDLFTVSARRLEVEPDLVVTAQQVGAYKPSLRNFHAMRERLAERGVESSAWLHAAQSRAHDIVPARAMGVANVWVNRALRYGASAVTAVDVEPDLTVPSLAALADLICPAEAAS
jgi:2-haloacid dehalogenase